MDEETGKRQKSQNTSTKFYSPITKNSIKITAKATSYDSALSLARGLTAPIIHYDEAEFTNHIGTIVDNSVSTYMTARKNALANNAISARLNVGANKIPLIA